MTKDKDWDNAFTATELRGTVDQSPAYAGALSFMRRKYTRDLTGVDVAVTGIPLDTATTNRPGARFGPRAIRAASSIMCWERPWPWEFDPLERLAVIDYGDCEFDFGVPESVTPTITSGVTETIGAESAGSSGSGCTTSDTDTAPAGSVAEG